MTSKEGNSDPIHGQPHQTQRCPGNKHFVSAFHEIQFLSKRWNELFFNLGKCPFHFTPYLERLTNRSPPNRHWITLQDRGFPKNLRDDKENVAVSYRQI